jgi:hypothetical protein
MNEVVEIPLQRGRLIEYALREDAGDDHLESLTRALSWKCRGAVISFAEQEII